jgi:hypothetical protein
MNSLFFVSLLLLVLGCTWALDTSVEAQSKFSSRPSSFVLDLAWLFFFVSVSCLTPTLWVNDSLFQDVSSSSGGDNLKLRDPSNGSEAAAGLAVGILILIIALPIVLIALCVVACCYCRSQQVVIMQGPPQPPTNVVYGSLPIQDPRFQHGVYGGAPMNTPQYQPAPQ